MATRRKRLTCGLFADIVGHAGSDHPRKVDISTAPQQPSEGPALVPPMQAE
ncbi:hypothetical protein AA106555_0920 [Neokomagataea thailandica NBRC 106555]|uniref:Transposase n=1 Tax=Neokomagataea thailandica NBRC 106555 TaxID=1223520 RepID=A0ABQ0QPI7_9PROT|nr:MULTISPECIES: hypothetical protein [Neokomagataea]GBR52447.1 hypothetical protein AA106555_0920 [Neokomagataea thailandica NBRC 106555]